jgi:hypothetical protein
MTVSSARASRAIGAMFFSIMGAAWLTLWSIRAYGVQGEILTLIAICTVFIFTAAFRVFLTNREAHAQESLSPAKQKADKVFNIVNFGQWILVLVVGNVLNNIGHPEWILASAMCIIGLHFIPLAHVFKNPSLYFTGTIMVLWALAYPFIAKGGAANPIGCLGAGITLWGSALYALFAKPGNS